jgi:ABC-2 type transport system permease protein
MLRVEWLKLKGYRPFWILLGLYPVVLVAFMAMLLRTYQYAIGKSGPAANAVFASPPFTFPGVWQSVTYLAGFFHFFPCVLILLTICNEFQFRTHRQNLLDGWSRARFFTAKLLVALCVTVFCFACVALTGLAFGVMQGSTPGQSGTHFLGYFALQCLVYNAFAFWIAFTFRRGLLSLAIFFVWSNLLEKIVSAIASSRIHPQAGYFAPLATVNGLITFPMNSSVSKQLNLQAPESGVLVGAACVYLGLFAAITYALYRREDL